MQERRRTIIILLVVAYLVVMTAALLVRSLREHQAFREQQGLLLDGQHRTMAEASLPMPPRDDRPASPGPDARLAYGDQEVGDLSIVARSVHSSGASWALGESRSAGTGRS